MIGWPRWFPMNVSVIEGSLAFSTTRRISGVDVPCHWVWGFPYRALQIEMEHVLFFSNDIAICYLNGKCLYDTSDRIGKRLSVVRCSRSAVETGESSVIFHVHLAPSATVGAIEGTLERIWRKEGEEQKAIIVDGEVWRSTLKEGL